MQLIDTHCHIHDANYPLDIGDTISRAHEAGVGQMICVGTSVQSSKEAIAFAAQHEGVYASIGVHPHDTKDGWEGIVPLALQLSSRPPRSRQETKSETRAVLHSSEHGGSGLLEAPGRSGEHATSSNLIAVGEIGLDYFYTHSPREVQIQALEGQIDLALRHNLPIIFHVRDAFDDFWPIFDNFPGIRGVLHSFTDTSQNVEQALKRSLFIGVNGISTFTKDAMQQQMFAALPLEKLLLETDAPFLTPVPLRGKVNEPAFVRSVAEYHAAIRNISLEEIAEKTSTNVRALFALS